MDSRPLGGKLKLRKATQPGAAYVQWEVLDDGAPIALICKVGESRDNYPWDWYFTVPVHGVRRVTGVASTRAEALDELSAIWKDGKQHGSTAARSG